MWIPWILLIVETMIYAITSKLGEKPEEGISVMPFGSYSPKVYIVQRWLGYHLSAIASIIIAIILALYIGSTVQATKAIWVPVPGMFIREQIISTYALSLFNGATPQDRAFSQGIVPSEFENPTLIYSVMFLVFVIASLVGFVFGLNLDYVYPIAMILGIILASITFPYVYHIYSYGAVEPAYLRSSVFVALNGVPTALLGFPYIFSASHFNNNYQAEMTGLVSRGAVIIPSR